MPENFAAVMQELMTADTITEQPDNEAWTDMIERIKRADAVHQISEEIYWYFLEVLPPKWQGGRGFAFCEGAEPLQLFWQQNKDYLTRSLTWEETERFCAASGTPRQYWS